MSNATVKQKEYLKDLIIRCSALTGIPKDQYTEDFLAQYFGRYTIHELTRAEAQEAIGMLVIEENSYKNERI